MTTKKSDINDWIRSNAFVGLAGILGVATTGAGGGIYVFASDKQEIIEEANAYTDKQVSSLKKNMDEGFKKNECQSMRLEKYLKQKDLYDRQEIEVGSPTPANREAIKFLQDEVTILTDRIKACK